MTLLQSIVDHKWQWKIDYTEANPEETFLWARADLVVRIIQALQDGRKVVFLSQEYQIKKGDDPENIVNVIEDAIAGSGYYVRIEADNADGVIIGTAGKEN